MSSEAITRNDLKAVIDGIFPPIKKLTEVVLFNGVLTGGSAQLADNVANYERISIIAEDNDAVKKTFDIITNGNSQFNTYLDYTRITTSWYAKSAVLGFNGTTISISYNAQAYFSSVSSSTYVAVTKIIGYKDVSITPVATTLEYSLDEVVVGNWIDGKPIYRKVIPTSLTAGINSITAPSNIDTLVTLRGMEKESGGAQAPIPKAHNSTFAYQIGMYYSGGYIYIEVGSNLTYITSAFIICEYTKTTD